MKKKTLISIFILIFAVAAVYFLFFFKAQKWESITYELGTSMEDELSYYVLATPIVLQKGTLDLSAVDLMKVGDYNATVTIGKRIYSYAIHVEDTTAPLIELTTNPQDINIGIDYGYELFFTQATDLAGPVESWVTVNGEACDTLRFEEIADYAIGIYAKDINGNLSKEEFTIHAVDTLAPEIVSLTEYPYYAVGDAYNIGAFVHSVTDNSGVFETTVKVNDTVRSGEIVFDEIGEYGIVIEAVDGVGNASSFSVSVNADYKPELYGISDKTVKEGTEFDLLEGIVAWDNEDGIITDSVAIIGDVDMTAEGEYPIAYSVTDRNGLTLLSSVNITVSKNSYDTKAGEYPDNLVDKLLDADAFKYELLKEPDQDAAGDLVRPCQVSFSNSRKSASGFIYRIDRDYVYIATMGHAIKDKDEGTEMSFWLYNPTYDSMQAHKSTRREITAKIVKVNSIQNSGDDRAIFTICTSDIPGDVLIYLKEINKTNISNISTSNGIYIDNTYVAKDMYTGEYKKSLSVYNKTGADYDYLLNYFPKYKDAEVWLLTNEKGVHGQSGSLLFDGYGNPIASLSGDMTYGSSVYIGRHIWINKFIELYDELIAEKPEAEPETKTDTEEATKPET